ncbi:SRPBCC family protein [Aeromicrobium sp. Leaf350]|uniref:SRPBCC family protein n=1 Tax=Aeromicrobium sp. Leaf350 TaxID=2876565 RepID=UPI001E3F28CF|nr:SRPBCC family protein [Aeromicrobium sp. Leaf350]
MSATPTGYLSRKGDRDSVSWERTFRAPIADVWASITEPERLERWIGTWTGDPADGFVMFAMTAEGEDVQAQRHDILACERPTLLRVESVDEYGSWFLTLELAEADGVTTLTFSQVVVDAASIENVGPGWEYYLDRLVTAETDGDVESVAWDDYYPAQREHYVALAETIEPGVRARLDQPT